MTRLFALMMLCGCAGPGLFTDFSSVSVGTFTSGLLRHGARLPEKGEGYLIQPLWAARNSNYATDELVAAIARVARRVRREYPGGLLQIGDLSTKGGGESVLHRSHQNGRDADLIYYAVDDKGRPAPPAESMPRYGCHLDRASRSPEARGSDSLRSASLADLHACPPGPQEHGVQFGPFSPRAFDVARNWALVRALLEEPRIEVQYLFINEALKVVLLDYARAHGEDPALVDRADALLHQPGDSLPHDDHLHLRIFCSTDDRPFGCSDRGPIRWWKKRYKYMPPVVSRAALDLLASVIQSVMTLVM